MTRPLYISLGSAIAACSLSAVAQSAPPLEYTPLATPCRAVDTRTTATPVLGGTTRDFSPFAGGCNISVPAGSRRRRGSVARRLAATYGLPG
jgi:hypothetical protein